MKSDVWNSISVLLNSFVPLAPDCVRLWVFSNSFASTDQWGVFLSKSRLLDRAGPGWNQLTALHFGSGTDGTLSRVLSNVTGVLTPASFQRRRIQTMRRIKTKSTAR